MGRTHLVEVKNHDPDCTQAMAEGAPKPGQEQLKGEVLDMAKRCAASGFNLLVIDTENQVRAPAPDQAAVHSTELLGAFPQQGTALPPFLFRLRSKP